MKNINLLKQLYTELYEPKLLPQNLLENLSLDNYISVDFSKKDKQVIGITKCYLEDDTIAEYIYTFEDDKLIKLEELISNTIHNTLYDRNEEINKIKEKLVQYKLSEVC